MKKSKVIGLSAYTRQLRKELTDYWVGVQTANLIDYAKTEIKKLGDMIQTYNSANHMDRTGNLLNSLCWGVTYDGRMSECGFYRSERTNITYNRWGQVRGMGFQGGHGSSLHEFFTNDSIPVDGRKFAEEFLLSKHGKRNKWTVFFAILAPYWGYWESGFTMRTGSDATDENGNRVSNAPRMTRFMQFQVMTHIFDDVRMALKPSETNLTVYVPKYSYSARSAKGKKYKNRRGVKKIGLIR